MSSTRFADSTRRVVMSCEASRDAFVAPSGPCAAFVASPDSRRPHPRERPLRVRRKHNNTSVMRHEYSSPSGNRWLALRSPTESVVRVGKYRWGCVYRFASFEVAHLPRLNLQSMESIKLTDLPRIYQANQRRTVQNSVKGQSLTLPYDFKRSESWETHNERCECDIQTR